MAGSAPIGWDMPRIRVAACQINTVVGDLDGNVGPGPRRPWPRPRRAGADLAVFPELTVTGYPPEDLLGRPAFVADNLAAFAAVAAATGECAAVVGYVDVGTVGTAGQRRRPVPARARCSAAT